MPTLVVVFFRYNYTKFKARLQKMRRMTTATTKFLMSYLLTIFFIPIIIFYIVSKMLKGLFTESVFLNINASPSAIHSLRVLNRGHRRSVVVRALNSLQVNSECSLCEPPISWYSIEQPGLLY